MGLRPSCRQWNCFAEMIIFLVINFMNYYFRYFVVGVDGVLIQLV